MSGRVMFRDGERHLPTVEMVQHFPSRTVTVGRVRPNMYALCDSDSRSCLELNETSIQWPGGRRPGDGRPGECNVLSEAQTNSSKVFYNLKLEKESSNNENVQPSTS